MEGRPPELQEQPLQEFHTVHLINPLLNPQLHSCYFAECPHVGETLQIVGIPLNSLWFSLAMAQKWCSRKGAVHFAFA